MIAWGAVCVIFATFFFFVVQQSFTTSLLGEGSFVTLIARIVLPMILFSAFLGAVGVHGMIIPGRINRYAMIALASLSMFLFFQPSLWSFFAFVLFALGLIGYHYSVQADTASRINAIPLYTIAAGLGNIILVLIASVSLLYYSTYATRPYALDNVRTTLRDSIVSTTLTTVENRVPGFDESMTVDQVIANLLAGRISANLLPDFSGTDVQSDPAYQEQIDQLKETLRQQSDNQITPEQLDAAVKDQQSQVYAVATSQLSDLERQLIDQVRNDISDSLGIELQGDETIKSALQKITDRKVITIVEPYLHYAPIVFSASLFLLMYIFSFLYRYLTRGFGLLWYGVLRLIHFFKLREETIKTKRITLED